MPDTTNWNNDHQCSCPSTHHTYDCAWFDSFLDNLGETPLTDYDPNDEIDELRYGYDVSPEPGTLDNAAVIASLLGANSTIPARMSYRKCDHNQTEVVMPNGVKFYASAHWASGPRHTPDFAVYLDGGWVPDCLAIHLGWRDYGLPVASLDVVLRAARMAMMQATPDPSQLTPIVEVGCIGGHGRTGTFLAILHCLAQFESGNADAHAAIDYVRDAYCYHTIETDHQEWYVELVAATLNGTPLPSKPYVKPRRQYPNTGKWQTPAVTIGPKTGGVLTFTTDTDAGTRTVTHTTPSGEVHVTTRPLTLSLVDHIAETSFNKPVAPAQLPYQRQLRLNTGNTPPDPNSKRSRKRAAKGLKPKGQTA